MRLSMFERFLLLVLWPVLPVVLVFRILFALLRAAFYAITNAINDYGGKLDKAVYRLEKSLEPKEE